MRKLILFIVVVLAVGALLGQLMITMPGYIMFRVGDTSVQTSFWFGLLLLFAIFLALHFVLRLLWRMRHPVEGLRGWTRRSRHRQAMHRTHKGLVALGDGRWKRAERALTRSADDASTPLVNYLSAALAAHYQGRHDQADELLKQAQQGNSDADNAVALMQAQLLLDRRQPEQALAILTRLHESMPQHQQVLRLLKQAYLQVHDWEGMRRLLPALERHDLVGNEERVALERTTYLALLEQTAQNSNHHRARTLWAEMPDIHKGDVELVLLYASILERNGETSEAEILLRNALKSHWDARLIHHYGLLSVEPERQLATAEKWLQERPNDPELLMALGRLSLRNAWWGKAQEYFEASHRQRPSSTACAELARLYANLGQHSKSQQYYQQSVELMDNSLPALPQPSEHTS
ncbi:heme biosynthesis HemY N-terminal domain-containing protein [Kushneria aurantia]|uniref:Heme biosynthesis HemY N-terminal domain-containing protein n=1 Tax=Kushneria aurantia TaxID=504092 RepID=A0ABV6G1X3_9GAMM|nr:heme biosynthesis HemY N-terminal domain-containing protein [Kushneria aurantia]